MTEEKKQSLQEISRILCEVYNVLFLEKQVSNGKPHTDMSLDRLAVTVEATKDLTIEELANLVRLIIFKNKII